MSYPPLWDLSRSVIEAGHRREREVIERELGDGSGLLLDLPCGTGIYAPLFSGGDYVGADLDERLLHHARRKFPGHRFLRSDALQSGFRSGVFARILVVGFLHHLPDGQVDGCLDELHRVLAPGGSLLLIEDAPTASRFNLLGKALQSLDAGDVIRPASWYEPRLGRRFEIVRRDAIRAGLWDYSVFVLRK
ncbi:MAG: class I SAM-dependent methyltransferase [Acidobacteriota bacterium]|nr:class I SAM-dependent methyltransferase [Acidobacteriota bacterium]MDH3784495.1 class I SAM-dependent methyltransferase [Acidobacteriota bacterium]